MSMTAKEIIEIRTPDIYAEYNIGDRLDNMILLATEQTGVSYGSCLQNAIALRVLHWITKSKINGASNSSSSGSGTSGSIASLKEGDLSMSFTNSSDGYFGDLSSTQYGQELLELANGCLIAPINRNDI